MSERPVGPFELRIPPDPKHLSTARLFISSLARVIGLDDLVDDLRLAVSEAVSAAILSGSAEEIVVVGAIAPDGLTVAVKPLAEGVRSDDRFDVGSIVSALFDGARYEDGGIVIPVAGSEA